MLSTPFTKAPLKILQASAGSGKTFSLTAQYIILLFSAPYNYRHILAVTFTNKATEEMKTRILEVLKGLAQNDASADGYKKLILDVHPHITEENVAEKATQIYRRILHDYSRFSVSTIDSFVQKIIRDFAFELGLDNGFSIELNQEKVIDELTQKLMQQVDEDPALLNYIIDVAKERISEDKSWNYQKELKDLANELFKERYQPFATAVANMAAKNPDDNIFDSYRKQTVLRRKQIEDEREKAAIDFLNAHNQYEWDSDQMNRKSNNVLPKIKTLDDIIKRTETLSGYVNTPEKWFKTKDENPVYMHLNPLLEKFIQTSEKTEAEYIYLNAVYSHFNLLRLLQNLSVLLKNYREEKSLLLISDVQHLLSGMLAKDPTTPAFIWEKTGTRYRHYLFDEFQDTSDIQWENFLPLVINALSLFEGGNTEHLVVGDVKQSIYRWRNGNWEILHSGVAGHLEKVFGNAVIEKGNLAANYRSTSEIIDFNNFLYSHAPEILQQSLNNILAKQNSEHLNNWWEQSSYHHIITSIYQNAVQEKHAGTLQGGSVILKVFSETEGADSKDDFIELSLQNIFVEINNLLERENYSLNDICLLVRTKKEATECVNFLMANALPVISADALFVNNNLAVDLIINSLYLLQGPEFNTALYKANCMSIFAQLNGELVNEMELFNLRLKHAKNLPALPKKITQQTEALKKMPLSVLIEKLIDSYELHQSKHAHHFPFLLALRDLVSKFALTGDTGISGFLQYWEQEGNKTELPASTSVNAIQVSTIHKSKGLAYRAVFLPFANWSLNGLPGIFWVPSEGTAFEDFGTLPLKYVAALGKSQVAEHYFSELMKNALDNLNMLYVATTRCKEFLHISIKKKKNEDSIVNVSDLLWHTLTKHEPYSSKADKQGNLELRLPVSYNKKSPGISQILSDTLSSYPLSDRLNLLMDEALPKYKLEMLMNEAGKEGTIVHEMLSRVNSIDEVDINLQQLITEGLLPITEKEKVKQQVMKVLMNKEVQQLLQNQTSIFNEQAIVLPGGKINRPDKIIFKEDETLVLDYKFTGKEHKEHGVQVKNYVKYLKEMGYENVKGYIFYAATEKLRAITD